MPGKNKKGGSGYRKMARKNIRSDYKRPATRTANTNEGEIYAKVIKCYGNGMVDVICNDGITRLCIIRKKFKGRNKKDNSVNVNSIVLVGLRTWEVLSGNKKPKVDLLCTYTASQIEEIQKDKNFNIEYSPEGEEDESGIEFSKHARAEQFLGSSYSKNKKVSQKYDNEISNGGAVETESGDNTNESPKKLTTTEINWDDI